MNVPSDNSKPARFDRFDQRDSAESPRFGRCVAQRPAASRRLAVFLSAFLWTAFALALTTTRAQIAVRGDIVYTMAGRPIENGIVVIKNGKIASVGKAGEVVVPMTGPTNLYIYPGYSFRVVDHMITNFHLPRSTLIMLVSAFAGRDLIMRAYAEAIRERYRFYSFGDAMFLM